MNRIKDSADIKRMKHEIKGRDLERLSRHIDELRRNPRLTYLFIELTDSCNLFCRHCGSSCDRTQEHMIDTDMLLRSLRTVAEDFNPESVMICLTGGEPMLHKDFYRIISEIDSMGFPWGMTTNGTLIDDKSVGLLKQNGSPSITISIDGLEPTHDWLRNSPGSFQKAAEAVSTLQDVGIPVQVTSVIHNKNFCELEKMYQLMCRMGVSSWRVINIEPIGRTLQNRDLLLSCDQWEELLGFIREKRYSKETPMDVCYGCSHYVSFEYEHEIRDNYFICGSGLYVGSILWNGDIYSCLDIERRPELVQGNIAADRFSKVWYERFEAFRENRSKTSEFCKNCEERKFCNGDSTHTWDFEKKEPRFCMRKEKKF